MELRPYNPDEDGLDESLGFGVGGIDTISPETQRRRDLVRVSMLQNERSQEEQPDIQRALDMEIADTTKRVGAPALRRYDPAKDGEIAQPKLRPYDPKADGIIESKPPVEEATASTALQRGIGQAFQSGNATLLSTNQRLLETMDRIDRGESVRDVDDPIGYQHLAAADRAKVRAETERLLAGNISDVVKHGKTVENIPQLPALEKLSQAKSFGEVWDAFKSDPLHVIEHLGLESLPQMAPGVVAGMVAGPGGAPAVAAAMGAGSYASEYGATIISALQQAGVDVNDPQAILAATRNPALMERVRNVAGTKASVVGSFDALSGGVASKVLVPARAAAKPVVREAANLAAQAPVQGALGAAGEAASGMASGQSSSPGDVAGEFLGEFAGTPLEVAVMAATRGRVKLKHKQIEQAIQPAAPSVEAGVDTPADVDTRAGFVKLGMTEQEAAKAMDILKRGMTAEEEAVALSKLERMGTDDVKALRDFTKPTEVLPEVAAARAAQESQWSVVSKAADMGSAAKEAARLSRETGTKHRARLIGGAWSVVKDAEIAKPESEGVDARAVESEPAPAENAAQPEGAGGEAVSETPTETHTETPDAQGVAAIREAAAKIRAGDAKTTAAATAELDAAMEKARAAGVPQSTIMAAVEGKQSVDEAAHSAATSPKNELPEPTEAQAKAGNYSKGHTRIGGLDISIENPEGSKRRPEWPTLQSHYGYIRQSEAKDGDHVDAFIKPGTPTDYSGPVFVIDQHVNGKYDEAKVMLGWPDEAHARDAYLRNYSKGWKGIGGVTEMSMDEFKAWVKDPAKTKKPAGAVPVEDFKRRSDGQVKVFETEDNARRYAAQRSNRVPGNFAPRQEGGQWVLSRTVKEKTPKQKAAAARMKADRTTVRPEDDLLKAMSKLGGLKASEITTDGGDAADLSAHRYSGAFGAPPFRATGGLSLDAMAEALGQHGYDVYDESGAVDATKLRELVDEAIGGRKVYTPEGNEHWAAKSEAEKAKAQEEQLKAVDLIASGFDRLTEEQQDATTAALASVEDIGPVTAHTVNIDPATEDDAFWSTVNAYLEGKYEDRTAQGTARGDREAATRVAEGGEADRASEDSPRAASGDEGVRFARAPSASWVIREKATGKVIMETFDQKKVDALNTAKYEAVPIQQYLASLNKPNPSLELTGETEAQIKQREALEKKAAEDKRKKDSAPPPSDFTLTGSDRPVDVAEAHGQKPLFARTKIADEKNLIVQHNITAENILHVDRMGGMAVPSLAITKVEQPLKGFGEVTLLGPPEMADPKGYAKTKVFGADVYSPRYPDVSFRLSDAAIKKLDAMLKPYRPDAEKRAYYDTQMSVRDFESRDDFRAYAKDKLGDDWNMSDMDSLAAETLRDAGATEHIFAGFDYNGNKRFFSHTLERVVKMLKQELRGGESSGNIYGLGQLRSKFAPQFRSINAIQASKDKILSEEKFAKVKAKVEAEFFALRDALSPYYGSKPDPFRFTDTVAALIEDAAKMGLDRAAKEYGFEEIPQDVRQQLWEFTTRLRNMPTEYFEGKILRDVDLAEFRAAVVPDSLPAKAREVLEKRGLSLYEYPKGDEKARAAAIKQAATEKNALFARFEPHTSKSSGLPVFTNAEVSLANAREHETQPVAKGVKRLAFDILDSEVFKATYKAVGIERAMARAKVGEILLQMRGNEFVALDNIEMSARGKGYGEKVIRSMLDSQDTPVHIVDIQPDAVDFWVKMGAQFPRSQDYMEARLDRFQYATKQRQRGRNEARSETAGRDDAAGKEGARAQPAGEHARGATDEQGRRRSPPDGTGFNRQAELAPERGLSISAVKGVVTPIVTGWANAPDVNVIASMADAPKAVRQLDAQQLAQDAEGRPYAFFHGGAIYLIADEIKSPQQAITGLFHEGLGHYGLRGVFGSRLDSVLNQLVVARRREVVAKAKEYGLDPLKRADLLVAAEEVLAEMAQTRPEIGFARRAIAAIRTFLRSIGVDLKMSDDEIIRNFILPARAWVEKGHSKSAIKAQPTTFHRAYHGSPHDFDRFDISKIGTGEGAQAYGHGLYFAGKREVAEWYKNKFSNDTVTTYGGKPIAKGSIQEIIYSEARYADRSGTPMAATLGAPPTLKELKAAKDIVLIRAKQSFQSTESNLRFQEKSLPTLHTLLQRGDQAEYAKKRLAETEESIADLTAQLEGAEAYFNAVKAVDPALFKEEKKAAKLYEVELAPKEDEYLDWDKPLRDQSPSVIAALVKAGVIDERTQKMLAMKDELAKRDLGYPSELLEKGSGLYHKAVVKQGGGPDSPEMASRALAEEGIPGIKYLDGSSRNRPLRDVKREFLAELPEDASFEDVMELVGTGRFSPKNEAILKALQSDDWLGFDYPAQALSAALGGKLSDFDASPALIDAVAAAQDGGTHNYVIFDDKHVEVKAKFARAKAEDYGDRVAKLEGSGRKLSEVVADLFHSDRSFNWWHRSVGTQYHKAQVDPDFKRVFDKAQDHIHEFSRAALESADRAPTLLPQINGLRGVIKSLTGTASQADIKAVAKPILDGTLQADDGDPHQGRVWKDSELREHYKLTDAQIKLYREFRSSVDHSLDLLLLSEVAMLARDEDVAAALAEAREDPGRAAEIVGDALAAQAKEADAEVSRLTDPHIPGNRGAEAIAMQALGRRKIDLAQLLYEKQMNVSSLKEHGYAPLMRFGRFPVSAYEIGPQGEERLVYFSLHEKRSDANAVKRQVAKQFPKAVVRGGVKSEEAYQLYQGLTPDSLELFAHTLGVEENSIFQDYIRVAKNSRSALKRLIGRTGVAGFEADPVRTLAAFITSNARAVAGNWHMGELTKAAEDIPQHKGDVKDDAVRLVKYLQNPDEKAAGFRSFLFVQYLGGSISAALVNMTQPFTMTYPYLTQWGAKRAAEALQVAMVKAATNAGIDPELAAALKKGEEEGHVAPHEVHMLHAESMRTLGANIWTRRLLTFWGSFFAAAEAFNRRSTFIAAYDIAKQTDQANPYDFAVKAIEETQGIYNRANRPNWARGTIGSTVFTFKQYSISYLEFLKRLPPRQKAVALAVLFLAAGLEGLPFAEDIEDLIDTIAQAMGYSFNTRQALRKRLTAILGHHGAQFVLHGASHLPGVPLDVQGRLSMGNLIPGSSVAKLSTADTGKEIADVLGPAGALSKNILEGAKELATGDLKSAARKIMPTAVQNVMQAVDMWQTGMYRDSKQRKVMDTTKPEAIIKGVGFQPSRVAQESKRVGEQMQNIALHKKMEAEIADQWARGRFEFAIATNDAQRDDAQKKMDRAKKDLAEWNSKNPEAKISIHPDQLQRRVREMRLSREQRTVKRAPKEIRGGVREEMSE